MCRGKCGVVSCENSVRALEEHLEGCRPLAISTVVVTNLLPHFAALLHAWQGCFGKDHLKVMGNTLCSFVYNYYIFLSVLNYIFLTKITNY